MQLKSLSIVHNQLPDAVSFLHGFLKELLLPSLQTLTIAESLSPAGIERVVRLGSEPGVASLKSLTLLSGRRLRVRNRLRLGFAVRLRAELRRAELRFPAVVRAGDRRWKPRGRFIQRGTGIRSAARSPRIRSGSICSPSM